MLKYGRTYKHVTLYAGLRVRTNDPNDSLFDWFDSLPIDWLRFDWFDSLPIDWLRFDWFDSLPIDWLRLDWFII